MLDRFAESTQRLIADVMKEGGSTRYDAMCEEIWLVLAEGELLESHGRAVQGDTPKVA